MNDGMKMNFTEIITNYTDNQNPTYTICENNNQSIINNSTNNYRTPATVLEVTTVVLYCLIFLVGVVGNVMVVATIAWSRHLKTAVNAYLMNLCVADLLLLVICMPTALVEIFAKTVWYFGPVMCKLVPFLEHVVASGSILTIMAISLERYRVIRHPLKSMQTKPRNTYLVIAAIWLVSLVSCSPWLHIVVYKQTRFMDGSTVNVCRIPMTVDWKRMYSLVLSVAFYALPALVLITLNICIFCLLRHSRQKFSTVDQKSMTIIRRHQQVSNNIACVVLIFLVCHLPFRVISLWFTFAPVAAIRKLSLNQMLLIIYFSRGFLYLNHSINPLIYNFGSNHFRGKFRVLIWTIRQSLCGKTQRKMSRTSLSSSYITMKTLTIRQKSLSN